MKIIVIKTKIFIFLQSFKKTYKILKVAKIIKKITKVKINHNLKNFHLINNYL